MNWNPPWWVPIYLMIFENQKISKMFGSLRIFFCFTIHKKLKKSCLLEKKISSRKKNCQSEKNFKKKFVSGTHRDFNSLGGWVSFHPVVVIDLCKNLLFKSVLAHCELIENLAPLWASTVSSCPWDLFWGYSHIIFFH